MLKALYGTSFKKLNIFGTVPFLTVILSALTSWKLPKFIGYLTWTEGIKKCSGECCGWFICGKPSSPSSTEPYRCRMWERRSTIQTPGAKLRINKSRYFPHGGWWTSANPCQRELLVWKVYLGFWGHWTQRLEGNSPRWRLWDFWEKHHVHFSSCVFFPLETETGLMDPVQNLGMLMFKMMPSSWDGNLRSPQLHSCWRSCTVVQRVKVCSSTNT